MKHLSLLLVLALLPMLASLTGCETMSENPRATTGAAVGVGAGALIGGIIGHQSGNTATGAVIGGLAGGALGGGIGYYLDRQQKRFQQIQDVQVEKVTQTTVEPATREEVPPHLTLRLSNEVLFETGSSALSPAGNQKMREVANVLRDYPDSHVIVTGYASAEGSDASNMDLSERRAKVVKIALIQNGVNEGNVRAYGMGTSNPIGDNSTQSGRAQNRRVDIEVIPPAGSK